MAHQRLEGGGEAGFASVVESLRRVPLRPEVTMTDVPAPSRIAPDAAAFTVDIGTTTDPELATGRFVLLHDPAEPDTWGGAWRMVTFARAGLEEEFATDPFLGDVGWSWLVDSLAEHRADYVEEAGTVTRVVSSSYAGLADRPTSVEMEIRASWTPADDNLREHFLAWVDLLCTIAGLPPLPDGVVALPGRRR